VFLTKGSQLNQPARSNSSTRWRTIVRRVVFVLYLLFAELLTGLAARSLPETSLLGCFLQGASWPPHIPLALWLTTRIGIWHSAVGVGRMMIYTFASLSGGMLYTTTLARLEGIPDHRFVDYRIASLMLLSVTHAALLFWPLVTITNALTLKQGEVAARSSRFSISAILGITALVAIFLASYQFYRSFDYSYNPWLDTPFFIGSVLAVFVLFYGLTKKWWIAMVTFAMAIAIEFLGRKLAFDIIYLWEGGRSWTAGVGLTLQDFIQAVGRTTFALFSLTTANLLEIRYSIGVRREPATTGGTATIDAEGP
jgi:hypothetical protein